MRFQDEEEEIVLRMFRVAKAMGCKFYCGSDAHTPGYLKFAVSVFEHALPKLELSENDRFYIEK